FLDSSAAVTAAIRKLGEVHRAPGRQSTRRHALRIQLDARARYLADDGWLNCTIADGSLTGALVIFPGLPPASRGERIVIEVPQVGVLDAAVVRSAEHSLGVQFEDVEETTRDNLIRFLYTVPRPVTIAKPPRATSLLPVIARRLFGADLI